MANDFDSLIDDALNGEYTPQEDVINLHVVGVKFEGRQGIIKNAIENGTLYKGCPILLIPEPTNPMDKNAIKVILGKDPSKQLGYIPKDRCLSLLRKINNPKTIVTCTVLNIVGGDNGYSFGIELTISIK